MTSDISRHARPLKVMVLFALLSAARAFAQDAGYRRCESDFRASLARLRSEFDEKGKGRVLPEHLQAEISWADREKIDLSVDASRLAEREDAAKSKQFFVVSEIESVEQRNEELLQKVDVLQEEEQDVKVKIMKNEGRRRVHNSSKPAGDEPGPWNAWNAEARVGQAERDGLETRLKSIQRDIGSLYSEKTSLNVRFDRLNAQLSELTRNADAIRTSIGEFSKRCVDSTQRLLALSVIPGSDASKHWGPATLRSNPFPDTHEIRTAEKDLFRGIGWEIGQSALSTKSATKVLSSVFKTAAPRVALAPGVLMTAADILGAGMDERSDKIAQHLMLLGDYASALEHLHSKGRLHAGDPGYDAIRAMLVRAGEELPGNELEFSWQSLQTYKAFMAALAVPIGKFVDKRIAQKQVGDLALDALPDFEFHALGDAGAAFFGKAIDKIATTGGSLIAEEAFRSSADIVKDELDKAGRAKRARKP